MTFETIKQGDPFVSRGTCENRGNHTFPCSKAESLFHISSSQLRFLIQLYLLSDECDVTFEMISGGRTKARFFRINSRKKN